jgi:hypothetical protein
MDPCRNSANRAVPFLREIRIRCTTAWFHWYPSPGPDLPVSGGIFPVLYISKKILFIVVDLVLYYASLQYVGYER